MLFIKGNVIWNQERISKSRHHSVAKIHLYFTKHIKYIVHACIQLMWMKIQLTLRRVSTKTIIPDAMKECARASMPFVWLSFSKKAIKLISRHSILDAVNNDSRFHATSFPWEHCHACLSKNERVERLKEGKVQILLPTEWN